ncbi:MAG: Tox-REase-5 domain-containing protein [Moheibacter sp.]
MKYRKPINLPDEVAAFYTSCVYLSATYGKKSVKECVDEDVEQAVKKNLDDIAEAGGKKSAKELAEAAANKKGQPGNVVTKKKPRYKIGESDGGPGTWENRHSPKKGADYQKKTTGAPDNTEYVVKTDRMKSGEKKYDGYDPETNTLLDAKDWDKWPPEGQNWAEDKVAKEIQNDLDIANDTGANLEYHVPTQEKADQIISILDKKGIEGVNVTVTPK